MGTATLQVKLRGRIHPVEFLIIEQRVTPIVVLQTCNE